MKEREREIAYIYTKARLDNEHVFGTDAMGVVGSHLTTAMLIGFQCDCGRARSMAQQCTQVEKPTSSITLRTSPSLQGCPDLHLFDTSSLLCFVNSRHKFTFQHELAKIQLGAEGRQMHTTSSTVGQLLDPSFNVQISCNPIHNPVYFVKNRQNRRTTKSTPANQRTIFTHEKQ